MFFELLLSASCIYGCQWKNVSWYTCKISNVSRL